MKTAHQYIVDPKHLKLTLPELLDKYAEDKRQELIAEIAEQAVRIVEESHHHDMPHNIIQLLTNLK